MIGKITKSGWLKIKRRGKFKTQWCMFSSDGSRCSDACSLFGEPEKQPNVDPYPGVPTSNDFVYLNLCRKELVFDGFIDERET